MQCVRAWETPCPPLINPFAPEPLASVNEYPLASVNEYPVYVVPEPEEVQLRTPKPVLLGPDYVNDYPVIEDPDGRIGH